MKTIAVLIFCSLLWASCSYNGYETGDNNYSYFRADFVQAHVVSKGMVDYVQTDDGRTLRFSTPHQAAWAQKKDSLYRALLYYNDKETGAEPFALGQVLVMNWYKPSAKDTIYTDPVTFQSAWISANRQYINMNLALKTGYRTNAEQRQSVGLVCDSVASTSGQSPIYYLRFAHRQNNVPQYYSTDVYISIPVTQLPTGAQVRLVVNTYDGRIEKNFVLP